MIENQRTQGLKIVWFGYSVDKHFMNGFKENGGKALSSQKSQTAILSGFAEGLGKQVDTYDILPLANYPKSPVKRTQTEKYVADDGSRHESIGYLNYKYVDRFSKAIGFKRAARKAAKESEAQSFLAYGMTSYTMTALKAAKKKRPQIKTTLIVTDLPEYMDLSMSRLKKMLKAVDKRKIRSLMKYVDSYVLYAAPMAEKLQLKDNQWMVMEGLYDIKNESGESENGKYSDGEKTVIMYSGLLEMKYGIGLLIEAFSGLEGEKYELWISGSGKEDCLKYIEKAAMQDKRIKYLGYFDSLDELKQRQRSATMMINMRLPSEEASRYCFPSKLFDYLMSAKPVLSFKLGGIPEEYNDKLVQIEEETPEAIRNAIQKVETMKPEERDSLGEKAVKFVAEGKNSNAQTQRILDFLQKSCK